MQRRTVILIFQNNPFSIMHRCWILLISTIAAIMVIACGCTAPSAPVSPTPVSASEIPVPLTPAITTATSLSLSVDSLSSGSQLPDLYTCKGNSESPGVSWDGIPEGTKSLVLILDDPDAPSGTFTHWILYNIPPQKGSLAPAQPNAKVLANGAQQGDTSAGSRGYYPPCPPIGTTHHYVFRLYAVDMAITQPTADRDSVDWALTGHTIAETEMTTTFTR